ncbi:MAG: ATP-binding cassette domain-containing protein [Deltaproteobacteria bacterium]|nr:MAG: ATP-binding cassette domain-containing protein [Deltaproteobacteria bacterium]
MKIFLIGRDLSNPMIEGATLVEVAHPQVSSQHLTVEILDEGSIQITDLGSTNGTRINQSKDSVPVGEPQAVTWDDVLFMGSFRYPLRRLQEEHIQAPMTMTLSDGTGQFTPFVVQAASLLTSTHQLDQEGDKGGQANLRPTISLSPEDLPLSAILDAVGSNASPASSPSHLALTPVPKSKKRQIDKMRQTISLDMDEFKAQSAVQTITLGRADDNNIVLPFPSVSAHHACLYRSENSLVIADLGSTNGTFVDGRRIRRPTQLSPGKRVLIANHPLVVLDDLQIEIQGTQKLRVDVEDVCVIRGKHRLLDSVSVSFNPYEIVAIMGPSGSGKSTLLKTLTGIHNPEEGEVRYNGVSLHKHYNNFRGTIGYVPQDDLLYKELTVFQSVMYTGRIRLPRDWTRLMIEERSEQILRQLGLWEHQHKQVSQLSGGQRKRLVLAQELLTDPPLLFLDEPTSGLSARDSYKVLEILRKLADEGKSICLVIHQPSARIFEMMDQLLLLTYGGKLAYYGPTTQAYDYFKTEENPDELLFCLEEEDRSTEDWKQQYLNDLLYKQYVKDRMQTPVSLPNPKINRKGMLSLAFRQWWLLSSRYLLIKTKDVVNTALLLTQAPIIAGLLCLLLIKTDGTIIASTLFDQADHITPMFVLGLSALWLGCANSAREIVSERVIYERERMLNLKLFPYVLSKFSVLLIISGIQSLLLLGICKPFLHLEGSFVTQFVLLLLTSCSGLGLGLFLSAIVNSSASAASILPLILLPQIIFGGYLVPTPKTDNPVVKTASYLTITRWSFAALLQSEYRGFSALKKYKKFRLNDDNSKTSGDNEDLVFGNLYCYVEEPTVENVKSTKPLSSLTWFRNPFEEFGFKNPTSEGALWKRPLYKNSFLLVLWTILFLICTWVALYRRG